MDLADGQRADGQFPAVAPVKVATLLSKWVYRKVRKTYAANADNALAVLDQLAGDCTEHSLLFVALARSVGLPAREVGGLAYAKADGAKGVRVGASDELLPALNAAFAAGGVHLVIVPVDYSENKRVLIDELAHKLAKLK